MNTGTDHAMYGMLVLALLLSLLACGGGGDSSSQDDPIPADVEADTALKTERVSQVEIDRNNDGRTDVLERYFYDNEGQLSRIETSNTSSNIVQKTLTFTTKDGQIASVVFNDLGSNIVATTDYRWNDNNTVADYQLAVEDAAGGLISMTTAMPAYEDDQMLGWVADEVFVATNTRFNHSVIISGGENGYPVEANETIHRNNVETTDKKYRYQWGPEINMDVIDVTSFGGQTGTHIYRWDYTDPLVLHHSSVKNGVAVEPDSTVRVDEQNRTIEVIIGQRIEKYTWEPLCVRLVDASNFHVEANKNESNIYSIV